MNLSKDLESRYSAVIWAPCCTTNFMAYPPTMRFLISQDENSLNYFWQGRRLDVQRKPASIKQLKLLDEISNYARAGTWVRETLRGQKQPESVDPGKGVGTRTGICRGGASAVSGCIDSRFWRAAWGTGTHLLTLLGNRFHVRPNRNTSSKWAKEKHPTVQTWRHVARPARALAQHTKLW